MNGHSTIPTRELYWALLEPASIGRQLRPDELNALAEDVLPIPIEELHLIQHRLSDGRVLVCGVELELLRSYIAAAADPQRLTPSAIPEFLRARVDEAAMPGSRELELLVGEFEPPGIRAARRRLHRSILYVATILAIVLCAGLVSRGIAARRALIELEARGSDLICAVLPPGRDGESSGALPPDLRLAAELRTLQATRSVDIPTLADITPVASRVLANWPIEVDARLDSIRVLPSGIAVTGTARDAANAQRIADALSKTKGFELAPPQLRAIGDGVTFSLSLLPSPGSDETASGAVRRDGGAS